MSSFTLYRETLCEHGLLDTHDWYTSKPLEHGDVPWPWFDGNCDGGSREEVTIDYEAAAKVRWDARFGERSWDNPELGPATEEQVQYTHSAFLNSARRDVDAALGITEDTE